MAGTLLAAALTGIAAANAAAQTPAATAAPAAREYAIPPGDLAAALARFAGQAGVTVLYAPEAVRGRQSPGLAGRHDPESALRQLLAGTGMQARPQARGAYVLSAVDEPVTQLPPVSVQADALRSDPAWASRTTRAELDARQVRDWTDLGNRVDPGVNFNRDNGSLNLRGLDRDRVATRIDGIRLPWLDDGARGVQGGVGAVDFDSLSRLDIVRGSDSTTVGSGAMGGAAELHTLAPEDLLPADREFGALLKGSYDSADTSRGGNVALAGRLAEDTLWLLQAGLRRGHELDNGADAGGYGTQRSKPDPMAYTQRNFLFKLQQRFDGGHRLGLTGEYFKREEDRDAKYQQGPGTSYAVGGNDAFEQSRRERVSLDYRYDAAGAGGLLDTARMQVYWQRLRLGEGMDAWRTVDSRAAIIPGDIFRYGYPSGAYGRDNTIQESLFGAQAEASRRFDGVVSQRWTVGAEWTGNRTEQYSGGYDNCPDLPAGMPAPFGPRACDMLHTNQADMPRVKGSQWALWVQDEIGLHGERYVLTPSLRYDHYSQRPQGSDAYLHNPNAGELPEESSAGRFSPRLLASWRASEQVSLYAQYGYGFRAPSATELYTNYGSPGTYLRMGNPHLKPETSRGWELGARMGSEDLGGKLAFFDNRYRDFIDSDVPVSPDSPQWQAGWETAYPLGVTGAVNRARVRIYGAEASAHWRFARGWRTWAGLAWAVGKDQDTGQHLNSVAPLKAIVGLGYARERWGADAQLTTALRRSEVEYPEASGDAPYADFKAPGYGVVDLSGYWRPAAVRGLKIQAGIYNLFDKKYWNALNVRTAGPQALPHPVDWYTEPGRSVRVSLTYQY
ncbi:TonB-dependent hemoglobin/transferrin/lactoferrin family receptor [Bordetella sp. 2513F-2]